MSTKLRIACTISRSSTRVQALVIDMLRGVFVQEASKPHGLQHLVLKERCSSCKTNMHFRERATLTTTISAARYQWYDSAPATPFRPFIVYVLFKIHDELRNSPKQHQHSNITCPVSYNRIVTLIHFRKMYCTISLLNQPLDCSTPGSYINSRALNGSNGCVRARTSRNSCAPLWSAMNFETCLCSIVPLNMYEWHQSVCYHNMYLLASAVFILTPNKVVHRARGFSLPWFTWVCITPAVCELFCDCLNCVSDHMIQDQPTMALHLDNQKRPTQWRLRYALGHTAHHRVAYFTSQLTMEWQLISVSKHIRQGWDRKSNQFHVMNNVGVLLYTLDTVLWPSSTICSMRSDFKGMLLVGASRALLKSTSENVGLQEERTRRQLP